MGKARKYELTERELHVLIAVASFLVAEEKFRPDDVMSNQCSSIAAGIAMKVTAHLSGEEPMDEK